MADVPWTLRPYQVAALQGISRAWHQGHTRTLLVLATGTGKTTVFAEVCRRRRDAGRKPTLVIAHRRELITQAAERLRLAGLTVDLESGEMRADVGSSLLGQADVVVATIQSLKGRRLERWPARYFDTVVCDEAHHAAAASYRAVLDYFADAWHLGVTATPDRGDQVALGHVYPHLAYSYGIREGITDGYLAPLTFLNIDTPSVDLSTVRTTKQEHGRDLSADDLAKAMSGVEQLHEIAIPIAEKRGNRPTLVFVPSVEIAKNLAEIMAAYVGVGRVRALDGTTDERTRADVIERYQRGDINVLVNCQLFTEGFDAPHTACVAVARPTKSRALWSQMIGRGTRPAEGKADCLVLNLRPDANEHSLVSPLDLFDGLDLPDDIAAETRAAVERGEPMLATIQAAEERAREREERELAAQRKSHLVAEARYRATQVDPWEELGIDSPTPRDQRGPRATRRQAEVLEKAGFQGAAQLSIRAAGKLLDELTGRRARGLCTIKQMRALTKRGLRGDLSYEDARSALDALAAASWRVTPSIAEQWGAE